MADYTVWYNTGQYEAANGWKPENQVRIGLGGASIGSRMTRSYSAITCAPRSRRIAANSMLRRTAMVVVNEPYTSWMWEMEPKYHRRMCRVISQSTVAVA